MAKLKVIQLLEGLDAKEINKWYKYLEAEKSDSRPDLVKAAGYLILAKSRKEENIDREALYLAIYADSSYDDLRLRHLTSDLLKNLEKFIVNEELSTESIQEELYLLRAYRSRNIDSFYLASLKRLENMLEKHPFRNMDYHYYRFLLEAEKTKYLEGQKIRTVEPNLEQTTQALDEFYLAGKMYYSCSKVNHASVVTEKYTFDLVEESIGYIQRNEKENLPAIGLYYHVWCMLNKIEDQFHYKQFRKRIAVQTGLFPPEEARHLYIHAVNYCIKMMRDGALEYLREAFELYREMLVRNVFYEDGYMSPWMYKNITVAGLRLGESAWVEEFVNDYKQSLSPKFQSTAYSYNSAKVAFERGNLDRVLELLQEVEYQDIFYALDSKSILLKTYFELNEDAALDSLCSSFRVFLNRRREISEAHRTSYLNLIRLVKAAAKARQTRDSGILQKISEELKDNLAVSDVGWLNKKLAELESTFKTRNRR